jgi:hypothetical protein
MKRIHVRIVIGGIILMVAFFAWIYLLDGRAYFNAGIR